MLNKVLNITPEIDEPVTGINDISGVAEALHRVLSETYVLLAKSQATHWNANGPIFHSIHVLTEEHYNDLFQAVDDIAERIRSLGHVAPMSLSSMVRHSTLSEWPNELSTEAMVSQLAYDHELVAKNIRAFVELAEREDDVATADLLVQRIVFHEKASWMLKALVSQ